MTEIKEILKLSVQERIHLVQTIWDSIAHDAEASDIPQEHLFVLDKRIKAHKENPNDVYNWEDVKQEVNKVL